MSSLFANYRKINTSLIAFSFSPVKTACQKSAFDESHLVNENNWAKRFAKVADDKTLFILGDQKHDAVVKGSLQNKT